MHAKLKAFWGGFSFFWSIFCHFFMQNLSFLRGWVVFWSKKRHFFSCKTSAFAGLGALFDTFFCHFLVFFLCKTSVFCEAGWSFRVKKYNFFHAKVKFLRGWVIFLVHFLSTFVLFFNLVELSWKKGIHLSILKLGFCSRLNPFGDSFAYQFLTKK